jgi:hypothetical protein
LILLDPRWLPLVLNRRKVTTIRAGRRKIQTGPNTLVSGTQRVPIIVREVSAKSFGELTGEDATRDGFDEIEELRDVLRGYYGVLASDADVTIVTFDLMDTRDK